MHPADGEGSDPVRKTLGYIVIGPGGNPLGEWSDAGQLEYMRGTTLFPSRKDAKAAIRLTVRVHAGNHPWGDTTEYKIERVIEAKGAPAP